MYRIFSLEYKRIDKKTLRIKEKIKGIGSNSRPDAIKNRIKLIDTLMG